MVHSVHPALLDQSAMISRSKSAEKLFGLYSEINDCASVQ